MCGEPRVAAECTCTVREFGRCSRPTVRPGRNVNDVRDHGDGSDTRPRGDADERLADRDPRPRLAVLAGTVRRVGGPDHEPLPAGRDRPDGQDVLAAGVEPDGPALNGRWRPGPGHRGAPPDLPARWRGCTAVGRDHAGRECDGRDAAGARGRGSWPTAPMIPTWPGGSTVSRPRMGSSHRVREKPPARRPRVVVEEPAQSRPALAAARGGALGPPGAPGSIFVTYMNASKSGQLSRKGSMCVSRSAVWKESARLGRRPPWRSR